MGTRGALVIGAGLFAGCGANPSGPPAPPDLFLITLDTLRADRLGAYGDPLAVTPNIDGLAQESALFRDAWTPVPLTLPAHTSLLSGQPPATHGVYDNAGFPVPLGLPFVQERLAAQGYHTAAFVSAFVLDRSWGLSRGFSLYSSPFSPVEVARGPFGTAERAAPDTVAEALAWWRATPSPKLAWLHLYDAHRPWTAHPGWTGDPYRGEVAALDAALKPLFQETTGAWVVLTADHGESLWDEGELEHGALLTRSAVRVPLLLRPPGGAEPGPMATPRAVPPRPWAAPGDEGLHLDAVPDAPRAARVVEGPVSLLDVAPTLLALAGLAHEDLPGRDLSAVLRGQPLAPARVRSETRFPELHYGWSPAVAVWGGGLALRRDPRDLVWDPVRDPWAQRAGGTASSDLLVAAHLEAGAPAALVDAETAAALAALGYTAASPQVPAGLLPPAAEGMALLTRLHALEALRSREPRAAREGAEALVAEHPELLDAWFNLAIWRAEDGDADLSLAAWEALRARAPGQPLVLHGTAAQLRRMGRDREAQEIARQLQRINPADLRAWRLDASLAARQEDPAEVERVASEGLEEGGEDPFLRYLRGLARLQLARPVEALADLDTAAGVAEDLPLWQGRAHAAAGHMAPALAAWERAARAAPNDPRPWLEGGYLLADGGRCAEAAGWFKDAARRGARDERMREALVRCATADQ